MMYWEKGKKKRSFKTEKVALKELLKVKAAILSGQTKHIDNSQMTVSQWMDIWYETKKRRWKISTRQQRKKIIENYVKPLIGKYRLSLLGSNTDKDFKPRTVLTYHSTFKIAINAAVEVEIILRNRFTSITIDQDDVLDNFLLPGEFEHIFCLMLKNTEILQVTPMFYYLPIPDLEKVKF